MNKEKLKQYIPSEIKSGEKFAILQSLKDVEDYINSYEVKNTNASQTNLFASMFNFVNPIVKNAVEIFANDNNFKLVDLKNDNYAIVPTTKQSESEVVHVDKTKKEDVTKYDVATIAKKLDNSTNLGELEQVKEDIPKIIARFENKVRDITNKNSKEDFYANSINQLKEFDKLINDQFVEKNTNTPNIDWIKKTKVYNRMYKEWLQYYKKMYRIPDYIPNVLKENKKLNSDEKMQPISQFEKKNEDLTKKLSQTKQLMQNLAPNIKTLEQQAVMAVVAGPIDAIASVQKDLENLAEQKSANNNDAQEKKDITNSVNDSKENVQILNELTEKQVKNNMELKLWKSKTKKGIFLETLKDVEKRYEDQFGDEITLRKQIENNLANYYMDTKQTNMSECEVSEPNLIKNTEIIACAEKKLDSWIDKFCEEAIIIFKENQEFLKGMSKQKALTHIYTETYKKLSENKSTKEYLTTLIKNTVTEAIKEGNNLNTLNVKQK